MNNKLIENLKKLILEAGEIAIQRKNLGLKIERKGNKSPVTNADKEISELIFNRLKILTPEISVICEERPLFNIDKSKFWLIDPIDGTRSYIRRENSYTVNIGLIDNNIPTLGLIYQPEEFKLYYTDINGELKIEQHGAPTTSICHIDANNYIATVSSHYLNLATRYFLKSNSLIDLIRVPSSIKLCLIAEGLADIYPRFGRTMEWDIAAGHALIRATGGNIINAGGKQINYGKPNFENSTFFAFSKHWQNGHPQLF